MSEADCNIPYMPLDFASQHKPDSCGLIVFARWSLCLVTIWQLPYYLQACCPDRDPSNNSTLTSQGHRPKPAAAVLDVGRITAAQVAFQRCLPGGAGFASASRHWTPSVTSPLAPCGQHVSTPVRSSHSAGSFLPRPWFGGAYGGRSKMNARWLDQCRTGSGRDEVGQWFDLRLTKH